MTNEEAIETIKNMDTSEFGDTVHQSLIMAIEALEKETRFSKNDFYYSTDEKKLYRFDGEEWNYD